MHLLVIIKLILIVTYCTAQQSEEQIENYDDIHDLMKHLVKMYENPSITTHSQLRDATVIYLNKLILLENAIKAGTPNAERVIHEIHKEETYKHLKTAPFSMLVGHYGWNQLECAELENVIFKANDIWRYFLKEIIHDKDPTVSLPIKHRWFVW